MTTKDQIEICYWILYLVLIGITSFFLYQSAIKAVRVGRKLNDEQNNDVIKRNLFLTLFSYRGSPIHPNFVNALNQIDIVFHDTPSVILAWHTYYDALQIKNTDIEIWRLQRVEILSQMAISLGYGALKQTDIMKTYYPEGHDYQYQSEQQIRSDYALYLKSQLELNILLINSIKMNSQQTEESQI